MGNHQRGDIAMTTAEMANFLDATRVLTVATLLPSGLPHLTAMWFGVLDGEVWFETKAKSQKAVNLARDARLTCMAEAGETYDQLRGVSLEGRAEIFDDYDTLFRVAVNLWQRYTGPYDERMRPAVDAVVKKRVAVRVVPDRIRSWDHRKLGLPPAPLGGSTAPDQTSTQ